MLWEIMFLKATTLPTGYLGSGVYLSLLSLHLHGWMIGEETETGRRWAHFIVSLLFRLIKATLLST